MPRRANYSDFSRSFISLLPQLQTVTGQSAAFWNQLQVRTERITKNLQNREWVAQQLASASIGLGMLQALCDWLDLPAMQSKTLLIETLSDYLTQNSIAPCCQDILCLVSFVTGKRHDSIQTISQSLLPIPVFELVHQSAIDDYSKRLAYAMLVYYKNPDQLRLLMSFAKGEAVGYSRYSLVPRAYVGNEPIAEEAAEHAAQLIQQGVDLRQIDLEQVNQALEIFEAGQRANRRQSSCFAIHYENETAILFVLRELRESFIREVDQTVFGDEAELVVLRLFDRMRTIEEHSEKRGGVKIAEVLVGHLLGDLNVEYLPDKSRTNLEPLRTLLEALRQGQDEALRLQEIHLKHAPIEQSPVLILHCEKEEDLSTPLRFLEERQIWLLNDINHIYNLSVVFKTDHGSDLEQAYILRLVFEEITPDQYFVRYYQRGAGAPIAFRQAFEQYLTRNYRVNAIPTTR